MEHPKQRVFVFDKAELFFLFLFFIVMAITAFVLGMRLGKKQAELFLHPEAQKATTALELKSDHEEKVDQLDAHTTPSTEATAVAADEHGAFVDKSKEATTTGTDIDEETFKKLQTEYQKINTQDMGKVSEDTPAVPEATPFQEQPSANIELPKEASSVVEDKSFLTPDPSFIGKYTIQLGSYRTLDEAKNFAQGFLERGYKPLVREVEVRSQGTWYRVSLGVFESINAASQYIQKEKGLFSSFKKDQYFIQEIK